MDVLELLVRASYARENKADLLRQANESIEMTRWVVRMAHDQKMAGTQAVRVQRGGPERMRPHGRRLAAAT